MHLYLSSIWYGGDCGGGGGGGGGGGDFSTDLGFGYFFSIFLWSKRTQKKKPKNQDITTKLVETNKIDYRLKIMQVWLLT